MGGPGSGNWYRWSSRPVIEDGLTLDLNRLIRQKNVSPGAWSRGTLTWSVVDTGERVASISYEADMTDPDGAWMRLHYKRDDAPYDYKVRLTTTRPNYGGRRWWFVCPSRGTRAAKLHLPPGGDWFASRQAYGLAYRTQNEDFADRMTSKAQRIRRKLGGSASLAEPFPEKPKGMHWRTYERLCAEADYFENVGWVAAMRRFGVTF